MRLLRAAAFVCALAACAGGPAQPAARARQGQPAVVSQDADQAAARETAERNCRGPIGRLPWGDGTDPRHYFCEPPPDRRPFDPLERKRGCRLIISGTGGAHISDVICPEVPLTGTPRFSKDSLLDWCALPILRKGEDGLQQSDFECPSAASDR